MKNKTAIRYAPSDIAKFERDTLAVCERTVWLLGQTRRRPSSRSSTILGKNLC